mgnify:CR=1 FL=1
MISNVGFSYICALHIHVLCWSQSWFYLYLTSRWLHSSLMTLHASQGICLVVNYIRKYSKIIEIWNDEMFSGREWEVGNWLPLGYDLNLKHAIVFYSLLSICRVFHVTWLYCRNFHLINTMLHLQTEESMIEKLRQLVKEMKTIRHNGRKSKRLANQLPHVKER